MSDISFKTVKKCIVLAGIVIHIIVFMLVMAWNITYKPVVDEMETQFQSFSYIDKDLQTVVYPRETIHIPLAQMIMMEQYIEKVVNEYQILDEKVTLSNSASDSDSIAKYGLYTHAIQRFMELEVPCEGEFIDSPWTLTREALEAKVSLPVVRWSRTIIFIWAATLVILCGSVAVLIKS